MSIRTWPNPEVPGICPFQVAVPSGWLAVEPPGALLALVSPERDGVRSSVMVFAERLPDPVDVAGLADAALADCEPDSLVGPVLDSADQPLPVAVRRATTMDGDRTLVQVVAITTGSDLSPAGLRSVFALVGTCPAQRSDVDEPVITNAMASFALSRPATLNDPGRMEPAAEATDAP